MRSFDAYLKETAEVGYVESVVTPLFYVSGLPTIRPQEVIVTENGTRGIVQVVLPDLAEVLMLESSHLSHQERVARTTEILGVAVSSGTIGRIVDPFGVPTDGAGPIKGSQKVLPIDRPAPGIIDRVKVTQPIETGVSIVDLLVQIGRGQKELVAGDQNTGKTSFLLQAISRHAKNGGISVYVSVGKTKADLRYVVENLKKTDALKKTAIVAATSAEPVSLVFFAPFSGFSIAEYFRDLGNDILIAIDDMTTHAKFYREISLVAKKTPGRGSYPGDVFHLQARLLERSGRVKLPNGKSASITCLPAAETQEGDLTGFIQTNLMAMTDGHIFFDIEDFKRGRMPAINPALSVTRVGNQTQTGVEKELRSWINLQLNQYYRVRETLSFGVEVPIAYKLAMDMGEKIELFFNQTLTDVIPKSFQLIIFGLLHTNFWANTSMEIAKKGKEKLFEAFYKGTLKTIENEVLGATTLKDLDALLQKYKSTFSQIGYGTKQQTAA